MAGCAVTFAGQALDYGDKVAEGVGLGAEFAGVVPAVTELAAAADVGVGEDDSAVEQRETQRAES